MFLKIPTHDILLCKSVSIFIIIIIIIIIIIMVMYRDQNAGQNQNVRTDNSTFERVEEFKYLGTTLTNQILFSKKLRAD